MNRVIESIAAGLVVSLVAACGGNAPARQEVTHEWVPGNRAAELHFRDNNSVCANTGSASAYESCMSSRGYSLSRP